MKILLTLLLVYTHGVDVLGQNSSWSKSDGTAFSYAYISVEGKLFSKKLKVEVDFGDTPEQLKTGREYSEILTNRKSYAAILNYMVEKGFELVETLTLEALSTSAGTGGGGTSGVIFIMKKHND